MLKVTVKNEDMRKNRMSKRRKSGVGINISSKGSEKVWNKNLERVAVNVFW